MKSILLSFAFLIGIQAAEPAKASDWIQTDHAMQVQRINKQLLVYKTDTGLRAHYAANIVPTTYHPSANILPDDQDAAQILWRRTKSLLDALKVLAPEVASGFEAPLAALKTKLDTQAPLLVEYTFNPRLDPKTKAEVKDKAGKVVMDRLEPKIDLGHPRIQLAMDILALQRRISLANPLLGDSDLLLCLRVNNDNGNDHIANQYHNTEGNVNSALVRLSGYRNDAPVIKELLQGATVSKGRLAGQALDSGARTAAKLPPGNFGWPDVSYDGKQILFAWKEHARCFHGAENTITYFNGTGPSQYAKERVFHIFSYDLESQSPDRLRMLTDGSGGDAHASYMPNGRIVFLSSRLGGIDRCGGPGRTTKLFSMNGDGSDQIPLSRHETDEFSPAIDNNGKIIYSRWDYIDRSDCGAHHLWTCYPDGRDPRAPHGNYLSGKLRPDAEVEIQAIPGDHRLIGVATAHHTHGHTGSLIVLDLNRPDDDGMNQVRRFTPDLAFPETGDRSLGDTLTFACPWPLNKDFVLAGSDRGPLLVDAFGNRTLLVQTLGNDKKIEVPTREVIPLRARPRPPIIPTQSMIGRPAGEPLQTAVIPKTGTFTLINIYNSLKPWPKDTAITALRIVEIYPRSNTIWFQNDGPDVGVAVESLVRGLIGTVPVEADGSVRFEIPANRLVYFQALDAQGRAVQTMRSGTYIQPGANVTCLGCHEPKDKAPSLPAKMPLALGQPVRIPKSGPSGSNPVFFPALVQTVLDRQCVACHSKTRQESAPGKKMPPDFTPTPCALNGKAYEKTPEVLYTGQGPTPFWTVSYHSLSWFSGRTFAGRPQRYEGRTTPGSFGAFNSRLYPLLADGKHHDVKLSAEDLERLVIWMDLNSNFLGHYLFTEEQSRGILPMLPPREYPDTSDHPEAIIPITAKRKVN